MSLLEEAAEAFEMICQDLDGFGVQVELTNPAGETAFVAGLFNRVGSDVDPETGRLVQGQRSSVAVPLRIIDATGLGTPIGEAEGSARPWRVRVTDIRGRSHLYKVMATMPDDSAGSLVCVLEAYEV